MVVRNGKPGLLVRLALVVVKATGAGGLTLVLFLVLPVIQAIGEPSEPDLVLAAADVTTLPPPPPPEPENEPEPEEKEEPPPPELDEEPPPLDLAQLELALNPGPGDGWMQADFSLKLETLADSATGAEDLFDGGGVDQEPRAVYQASPVMTAGLRKRAPGTVWLKFIVDETGRVQNPLVEKSTDAVFEKAALDAIKKWKFEPGKRKGKAVSRRMRLPMTFPKS